MHDVKFAADKERGDRTAEIARQALGLSLVHIGSDFEDRHHNTDLYIDNPSGGMIRIGMRMRAFSWFPEHKYEFTLRCHKCDGGDSEFQKYMGTGKEQKIYGDYDIYGFQNKDGDDIVFWVVIDMGRFRLWFKNESLIFEPSKYDKKCGDIKWNGEKVGSCYRTPEHDKTGREGFDYFYAFRWDLIPDIVVATSEDFDW